jgi:probable rRNA maturation factor
MADQPFFIDVSVIGDRKMRTLNRTFRRIDESTDVLAFPTEDLSRKPDGMIHLGDVAISYPHARRMAIQMNRMIDTVLVELAIHGVKHLLGEHHE